MVSARQPRLLLMPEYYCDAGGDDGVSQHQQHLRRHRGTDIFYYLHQGSGQFSLSLAMISD